MTDRVLIALVVVGILACALAAFSLSAERRGIPRLLVALCLGLLIGPELLGVVDPTVLGYFVLIGTLIPVSWLLGQSPWLVPVLLLALLGRRLAAVWMLRPLLRRVQSLPETAFISWFAPVGVSALLYASLAAQDTGTDDIRRIVLVAIALSVLVHGLSTLPASLLLDRARARAARRG